MSHHDPGRDWRSIEENSPQARIARPPATDAIALLRRTRKKLYLLVGSLSGALLALIVVAATRKQTPPPAAPQPVAQSTPAPKPAPAPTPAPRTAAERMKALTEREKASPRAYRTLYRAWAAFRKDAPPEALDAARDHMERLHSAATKEYRVLWHPVHEKLRDLLGAHEPVEARKLLQAWKIPDELDVTGDHADDVRKQLEQIEELIAFEEQRTKLFAEYRNGDFSRDVVQALATWTGAPQVHVRVEADNAVAELKLIRALGLLKQKLASRRAAALARVDEARRQIAVDAAADKDRTAAWEARLKEQTARRPIPISQLGVKEMDDLLRVTKYNGRIVSLASSRMELTYSMDELPIDVFSRLVTELPDPTKPADLIEAGKAAVRRGAFEAARRLFTQAVRVDPTTADLVPDLARLSGGVGTLRGRAELQGETLAVRYDFSSADQARDFKVSPNTKIQPGDGSGLALEGEGLFWAMPGDLKFSGRIRASADPVAIGHAGYVVGVAAEITPGDPDLFVALVQPDRGYRLSRIRSKGPPETVGEGGLSGRTGMIELSVDAGRAELRIGGVTLWTGSLPEFTTLQPVAGAWAFQEGRTPVSYRSLRFEGRASPEWIRRLQSERLTLVEAELSRERRTTSEERSAAGGFRRFGDGLTTPLSLEMELAELIPLKVKMSYAAGRTYLKQLERAKSDQLISKLWGQVRQTMEEAIREAPWFPLTYYYRAEWRLAEGDVAGAMRDLGEASANQEGFVEARVARAELLVREGKYPEAAKEIDEALVLAPDLARARLTRALLNYYAGRDADAVLELELARRLEPGDMFVRRSAKRLRNILAGPRWSGSVAVETPDYVIRTESPRLPKKAKKEDPERQAKERTQKYADHLGAARGYFAQLVSGPESRARKPVIYICDTPESYYVYADFTSEDRLEHTAGVFFNQYQQLLFYRGETEEETLQTMTHEAFHEYLHAILPSVPTWLDEGLAEYASGVEIAGGRVVSVGRVLKGRLRGLQAALETGWEGFDFPFVLAESKEQFYSLFPELQYAQAWSMVHFLVHGKGGKHKPLLDRYLQVLKETRSPADARAVFTGADLPALQREWAAYVKSLQ